MKEKLEVIREALVKNHVFMGIFYDANVKECADETVEAIALLDSLIAELDAEDDNKLESEVPLYNSGKW